MSDTENPKDYSEQRENKRFDFECEVSAHSEHQFFTGFTQNISAGGLFVSTYQTLPLGSRFTVSFRVAGLDHEFTGTAEVAWLREYNESLPEMKPGMGARFVDLTPNDTKILNAILQQIETLFYDTDDL